MWLALRVFVPALPIFLQYFLWWMGGPKPPFPQVAYILLFFALSMATLTEHSDNSSVFYFSMFPASLAAFLYALALTSDPATRLHSSALQMGFYFWLALLLIGIIRLLTTFLKRESKKTPSP
jgi:hypothetical protein